MTLGRLSEAEQFENIIVKSQPPSTEASNTARSSVTDPTAAIVRIKDIARVELGQQLFTFFRIEWKEDGAVERCYTLPGANALDVANETRALMAEASKRFPGGLKYMTLYDTTLFINQSVHAVYQTLFEAGVLVLIVIMLFLQNFRAMLVPATTVPVTIIGAFAAMALLGFTVNLMTLFALILSIGIVVDDAIVIVENTSRYIEQGLTPKDAAIQAMSELTGPVLGITLVLTAVFLPASFLPGITGQMFRQFALVIAATAIISAINALTLKPTQCALYLRPVAKDRKVNWFYRGFNRVYGAVEARYIAVVRWMVLRPRSMLCLFHLHRRSRRGSVRDLSDGARAPRRPRILHPHRSGFPPAASQPRVRQVAADIDAAAQRGPWHQGLGDDRRLFRARIRRSSRTWSQRSSCTKTGTNVPPAYPRRAFSRRSSRKLSPSATRSWPFCPPPIPGLGQRLRVSDGRRRSRRETASASCKKWCSRFSAPRATGQGFLRIGFTTFSASSPQLYLND